MKHVETACFFVVLFLSSAPATAICQGRAVPTVEKLGTTVIGLAESNPIVYRGTNYVWESVRVEAPGNGLGQPYGRLRIVAEPNRSLGPFAQGLCLSCAYVDGDRLIVTGTRRWADDTFYLTETTNLVDWTPPRPILTKKGWKGFNTSVCRAGDRYVMVYERGGADAEVGCQYTMFFAESGDLRNWRTIPGASFGREIYTGSPCLRHHNGWFYFFYLALEGFLKDAKGKSIEEKPLFRMRVVRSHDLTNWTNGDRVVLGFDDADRMVYPGVDLTDAERQRLATAENRNASDIDMCETGGDLLISYSWGDQLGHEHLALACVRNCSERAFCESFFPSESFDWIDDRLAALREGGVEGGTIGVVTNFGDYATVDYELNPTAESRIRCRLTLPRPENWTGRMWGQGNGGPAGEVGTCAEYALAGDAAVHTDMGTHFGVAGKREALVDFGHRATHLMTVTGKALIERYYGRRIRKAYFFGQSTGGGQGIHEAERYPEDYDGIVAGVPANHRTELHAYFLNVKRQAFAEDGTLVLTDDRLRIVADAALDCFPELVRNGVRGRYLVNAWPTPARVARLLDFLAEKDSFFAATDIRRRLTALFRGLELKGRIVGPGLPLGANLSGLPMRSFWDYAWFAGPDFPDTPQGWLSITDEMMECYLAEMAPVLDATSADLTRFAARGGKLIFFGGLEDPIVPWQPMTDYFARAVRTLGGEEKAADCVRFYLEPGRAHTTGRAYSDFANIHQTIVGWVEKGERPDSLEAVPNVVPGHFADGRFGKLPRGPYLKVVPVTSALDAAGR